MEPNQRYAWMLFGLAAVCAVSASAYAMLGNSGNSSDPGTQPPEDKWGSDEPAEPGYVPNMPAAPTLSPTQPATIASSNTATPVQPVPVAMAYTAPGGWVWNPLYTHGVYWDVRRDPYWHYDWKWWDKRDNHWRRDGGNWRRHYYA